MAGSIRLLDCTLRDGGYVNNWSFGNDNMVCIYDRLTEAGVDIIELGFLDDRNEFNADRSIQPNTQSLMKAYANVGPKRAMVLAMIDYGTCSIDNVEPRENTFLDGIRVIFKKENMYKAADFGKQLIDKGYKVFLQLVSITDYAEQDIIDLSNYIENIHPSAVSIVDTYGLMHKEQVFHYFQLLDRYLPENVGIGYHSHNNFQLAYSNTIELFNLETKRDVVLDGTLYGMGKSAGNAPIELIAMHLNEVCGKHYDINQMMEAINYNILPIYQKHYWGYSLFFYIAAKNDCHPNYVKYLLDKKTLSIKDVDIILGKIDSEKRLRYSEKYIADLYLDYLLDSLNDVQYVDTLNSKFSDKEVLLIGPGQSVNNDKDKIADYSQKAHPITISVNFLPTYLDPDYVFLSNPLRYGQINSGIKEKSTSVIATSNITPAGKPFDYVLRLDSLISESSEIWDNALVILLNLLTRVKVRKVTLAGFDGFKENLNENYVDSSLELPRDFTYLSSVNDCLTKKIQQFRRSLDLNFLTDSIYNVGSD